MDNCTKRMYLVQHLLREFSVRPSFPRNAIDSITRKKVQDMRCMIHSFCPKGLRHMGVEKHRSNHFPKCSVEPFSSPIRLWCIGSSNLMGYPQRFNIRGEISFIFSPSISPDGLDFGPLSLDLIDPNLECMLDGCGLLVGQQ